MLSAEENPLCWPPKQLYVSMRLQALSILLLALLSPHELHFPLWWCQMQYFCSQQSWNSCALAISEGHCKARQISSHSRGQLPTVLALTMQQQQWATSSALAQSLLWSYLGDWLLFNLINKKQETDYQVEEKQSLPYLWITHEITASSPLLRAFCCYLSKSNYPNCSL